jgi:general secretion pathway protein F
MARYSYTALGADQALQEGVIEEIDKESAARRLRLKGLKPVEIKPFKEREKIGFTFSFDRFQRNKLTKKDIEFFTKQIGLLLNAGLSLDKALRVMKKHSQKPAFINFTADLERKLKEGKSFSQALSDHPIFSSMYINMARAGEEGGILPAMLAKVADYQATFQELKQYIISASIYPLFLLTVGIVAVVVLIVGILPKFEMLFEGMGTQLPVHVQFLIQTSKLIGNHFIIFILLLVSGPAGLVYYLRTSEGKSMYDRLAMKVPLLSGFIRDLETTRIFRTLEVLVNNGVHLATALKISSGVAGNEQYRDALIRATEALKEGKQIGQRLKNEGLLPELATDLLAIGEESGKVGSVCGQVADHYEQELRVRIKRVIALIEPLFILIIAVVAGYIVMSMLSVILSINDIAV